MADQEAEELYSVWVQRNFVKVNKLFGLSFEGLKHRVLSLLAELELRFLEAERDRKKDKKSSRKKGGGGSRELKKLEWSLNYEGKKSAGGGVRTASLVNYNDDMENHFMKCEWN